MARSHCITARVIGDKKFLIEKKLTARFRCSLCHLLDGLCIYNSYAHVAMYPLFALVLPDWRSMLYILNCSSYLKYRLRVLLRFNISWHDFAANLSLWHKCNVIAYSMVIYGRLDTRVETRCPAGFSISCFASRSRHFLWNRVLFSSTHEVFFIPWPILFRVLWNCLTEFGETWQKAVRRSSTKFVFFGPRWLSWSLFCWDIFDFSSVRNLNESWQESNINIFYHLPSLCFSDRSEN